MANKQMQEIAHALGTLAGDMGFVCECCSDLLLVEYFSWIGSSIETIRKLPQYVKFTPPVLMGVSIVVAAEFLERSLRQTGCSNKSQ